jgi:hypothetical protein
MAGLCDDDAVRLSYFSFFSNPLVDLLSMYRDFLWRVYPDPDLFASGQIPTPQCHHRCEWLQMLLMHSYT